MQGTHANIAQDYSDLAGSLGDVIANTKITKTPQQLTDLANASNALTDYSNQLADDGAWTALAAAQDDLDKIKTATGNANAKAAQIKKDAAKLDAILQIAGDAITLGSKIVIGDLPGALTATVSLASDAAAA